MTSRRFCYEPIPDLIQDLNRNLQGWAAYFSFGYPGQAYSNLNYYVQQRLRIHLRNRSQRPYRAPRDRALYAYFRQLGLRYLTLPRRSGRLFT
jgi:hypothetical protein